ncbi:hypothetical protein BH09ACT7_BH09ACT7_18970 [soil metagenome]
MIASTGPGNASIDYGAADELGISIANTGYSPTATVELTWAVIMASARNIVDEVASVRAGGWQSSIRSTPNRFLSTIPCAPCRTL